MESNNNSNSNDTIVHEVEELSSQSDENSAQLNEIREQISEIKDQNTERNILKTQAEDDQLEFLTETLTETNDHLETIENYLDVNNHLATGQFFFLGIICGIVLFRILFDRMRV